MSHLLKTVNPEVAARLQAEGDATIPRSSALVRPLPEVGTAVRFRLRANEYRNGTNKFAAIVTRQHAEKGTLDLVVFLGADDQMDQRDVPCAVDEEFGWELPDDGGMARLRADFEAFKEELSEVLFGAYVRDDRSVYERLALVEATFKALAHPAKGTKKKG